MNIFDVTLLAESLDTDNWIKCISDQVVGRLSSMQWIVEHKLLNAHPLTAYRFHVYENKKTKVQGQRKSSLKHK